MILLRKALCIAAIVGPASAFVTPRTPATTFGHGRSTAAAIFPNSSSSSIQPLRMIGSMFDLFAGGEAKLIDPKKALPGRSQKMPNIDGLKHYVLGNDLQEVPEGFKVAIFANGCFWGSEKGIWRLPKGIHSTAVGYCAGFTENPTYEEACSGLTGHTGTSLFKKELNDGKLQIIKVTHYRYESSVFCVLVHNPKIVTMK